MLRLKTALAAAMFIMTLTATAETVDCLTIHYGDGVHIFAIADIKEITFADDGISLVRADGATTTFGLEWKMTFGPADPAGLESLTEVSSDAPASVYTIDGRLVGSYTRQSDIHPEDLAPT